MKTSSVLSPRTQNEACRKEYLDCTQVYFEELRKEIAPLREALLHHPMYAEVNSLERLREFMQIHVFAVWDFMSLVKRLQAEVAGQRLPWLPPASARIARFANEVVLGEETDLAPDGQPTSHFELYLQAMDEVGADTCVIRSFIERVAQGERWQTTLTRSNVATTISDFVNETLRCAMYGSVVEVASCFLFGREDVIPDMFKSLLKLWATAERRCRTLPTIWNAILSSTETASGPWAREMLISLAGNRDRAWSEATAAAGGRSPPESLWDDVLVHLKSKGRS